MGHTRWRKRRLMKNGCKRRRKERVMGNMTKIRPRRNRKK